MVVGSLLAAGLILEFVIRSGVIIPPRSERPAGLPPVADVALPPDAVAAPGGLFDPIGSIGREGQSEALSQATVDSVRPSGPAVPIPVLPTEISAVELEEQTAMAALSEALSKAGQTVEQTADPLPIVPPAADAVHASLAAGTTTDTPTRLQPQQAVTMTPGPDSGTAAASHAALAVNAAWQPFWGPFNTRSSAQGFAARIARQTGLDIRVLDDRRGHMVAFLYVTEDERRDRKALIEAKTGLRLTLR